MLSYSFSDQCSSEDQNVYLTLAKEAFEIGLLTNTAENTVTSQLELHTLLKASYCLIQTHRWMSGLSENIATALMVCHEAMALFFQYSSSADFGLCSDITAKIQHIKTLLNVRSFSNSDPRSFIPDSYRSVEFGPVPLALDDFSKFIQSFRKHHRSVCETFDMNALRTRPDLASTRCITAFQIDTEATTAENPERLQETLDTSVEDEFMKQSSRSEPSITFPSRQNSSSSGSSFVLVNSSCRTEMSDDERSSSAGPSKDTTRNTKAFQGAQTQETQDLCTTEDGNRTQNVRLRASASSGSSLDFSYEHVQVQPQSSIETVEDVLDPCDVTSLSVTNRDAKGGSTSSYSLADSFGSRSSWEKLSISPATNTSSGKFKSQAIRPPTLYSTDTDPFEELGFEHLSIPDRQQEKGQTKPESCHQCFQKCVMGSDVLTERDFRCLLAGVCHACLMERLPNKPLKSLNGRRQNRAYGEWRVVPSTSFGLFLIMLPSLDGMVLKYSKASDVWTGFESSVYIGERSGDCGTQRRAVDVMYLHQEQLLSR